MVKNLPSSAEDMSSTPGQGTKIPHAAGQLNLGAATTEPESHNYRESPRAATKTLHASTRPDAPNKQTEGFPAGSVVKESACQCGRRRIHRFNPWVGKIPGRRKWQPAAAARLPAARVGGTRPLLPERPRRSQRPGAPRAAAVPLGLRTGALTAGSGWPGGGSPSGLRDP